MEQWYSQYWAQTWYRNTYLVRYPRDIGQAKGHDREWNNVYDSGCNFTCLAMIVGIDPARLASELSTQQFFGADRSIPARYLSGEVGGLVWDRNAPKRRQSISIPKVWHQALKRTVTIKIKLIDIKKTQELREANNFVKEARAQKYHVICGTDEHSLLVAGVSDGQFFVWDPDPGKTRITDILRGRVSLGRVFRECRGKIMEFWLYQIQFARL